MDVKTFTSLRLWVIVGSQNCHTERPCRARDKKCGEKREIETKEKASPTVLSTLDKELNLWLKKIF